MYAHERCGPKASCFILTETWILYPENDGELSNIVRDAYRNYEIREFGTKTVGISDPHRQIKLISIAEDEVFNFVLN